jgi:hypothetical protein
VVDAAHNTQLRMLDAVGTVADENKPAGDGLNLIRGADALNQVIGGGAIVAIKAVGAPDSPVRTDEIAAEGGRTEHYLALDFPKLLPGVYTLSMQVPAKTAGFMALQMQDGGSNGALVDYLPSERQVWINKKGDGDMLDATVRGIDDEWLQITLTSALLTETGNRIFIRLKDRGNRNVFAPREETITIRAVKLERGAKATPSKDLSSSHFEN